MLMRLARYDLMEPHAFFSEMHERMELDEAKRAAGSAAGTSDEN